MGGVFEENVAPGPDGLQVGVLTARAHAACSAQGSSMPGGGLGAPLRIRIVGSPVLLSTAINWLCPSVISVGRLRRCFCQSPGDVPEALARK